MLSHLEVSETLCACRAYILFRWVLAGGVIHMHYVYETRFYRWRTFVTFLTQRTPRSAGWEPATFQRQVIFNSCPGSNVFLGLQSCIAYYTFALARVASRIHICDE